MRRFIGASEGASIYIFGLVGGSLLSSMLNMFLVNVGAFEGMSIMSWITYATTQIAFVLVIAVYFWLRKVNAQSVLCIRKPKNPKQMILLPFISIAAVITFLPLADLFQRMLLAMGFNGVVYMPDYTNVGVFFLSVFVMAVLPAFGEEFLLRGALFSGLRTRGSAYAVLMSALLFSLMHANPLQTVHQFGLGVVLAVVVLLSGSVWSAVFVHFFNNLISISMTAMSEAFPDFGSMFVKLGDFVYLTDFAAIIVGAFMLACLLWWFNRLGSPKREGYRVVSDGVVYEEFAIYATAQEKAEDRKYKLQNSGMTAMFRFVGSLFTKRGWRAVTNTLDASNDVPYIGKTQPMFNVWLALSFGVLYWVLALIMGFI